MENLFLLFIPIGIAVLFFLYRKKMRKLKPIQLNENKPNLKKEKSPPIVEPESQEGLLRKATGLKGKDIDQAIKFIEKAISLNPDMDFDQHFKLASYFHYADRIEEAYSVYDKMLKSLKVDDMSKYNMSKSQILERICTVNYKNGEHENYLFNYSYWLYNSLLAFACQGKSKEMKGILSNKNKLSYLAPSKVDGCFKKLQIEDAKKYFNEQLNIYFNGIQDDVTFLFAGIKDAQKTINGKVGKRAIANAGNEENKLLLENNEVMKIYLKLNDESFAQFYNSNIKNSNVEVIKNEIGIPNSPSEAEHSAE